MVVTDVVYREDRPVLLRVAALGPEAGVVGGTSWRHTENHHRRALVVVDQRPELAQATRHRPFRHYVLPRLRVAL